MNFPFSTDFYKLWAKINSELKAGEYKILINNNYKMQRESGKKSIYISDIGVFGAKNRFLYITCMIGGATMYFFAFVFFFLNKITDGQWGKGLQIMNHQQFQYYSYELEHDN